MPSIVNCLLIKTLSRPYNKKQAMNRYRNFSVNFREQNARYPVNSPEPDGRMKLYECRSIEVTNKSSLLLTLKGNLIFCIFQLQKRAKAEVSCVSLRYIVPTLRFRVQQSRRFPTLIISKVCKENICFALTKLVDL